MSLRVIKLGGSLLTLPDWHERFLRWLTTEPPAINVLLIGGGELVDVLRREHERFPYTEKQMHFAALAAMEINAQLAHARLPEAPLLNPNSHAVVLPAPPSLVLVKVLDWWNSSTGQSNTPHEESWRITSDSLAAWLTIQLEASELVLLKSAEPPPCLIHDERASVWAALGYVDPAFPEWLCGKSCRAVNLRASKWDVV
jgi:aspartokinase-like uncharacterized kinase